MKRIRQLPKYLGGDIPAIALTAYAGDIDRQRSILAGFQTHLAKPVMPNELIDAVIELIGEWGSEGEFFLLPITFRRK